MDGSLPARAVPDVAAREALPQIHEPEPHGLRRIAQLEVDAAPRAFARGDLEAADAALAQALGAVVRRLLGAEHAERDAVAPNRILAEQRRLLHTLLL